CYAGSEQLEHTIAALLSHGRPREEPAAVIYDGTLSSQRTIDGTLEELARKVEHANDRRAAILVVGRVAALREHLRWFDVKPLFGKRVLVTRPRDQAPELVERLEAAGADTVVAALVRIEPPAEYGLLDEVCAAFVVCGIIVFL